MEKIIGTIENNNPDLGRVTLTWDGERILADGRDTEVKASSAEEAEELVCQLWGIYYWGLELTTEKEKEE